MIQTGQAQNPLSKRLELYEKSLSLLERELEWRQKNERFEFFQPNAKAEAFVSLVGNSPDYPLVFSAANGVSKTATVVNVMANLIWPGRNRWFDFERFKNWPFPKRIRYITDPELVKDSGPFRQEVLKWFPRNGWTSEKAGKQYYSQYHANGWFIDVLTTDQEVKQFEGGTFGLIVMDEPTPQPIYNACIGRLRLGGLLLVVMTPLTHAAWFYDQVVPKIPNQIIYADIEDACIQHGVRGHLDHDNIQKMIQNWPLEEVEARAHGKAMYLRGLIFKTFDPKVHVLKEPVKVPHGAQVYQAVDPHSDKPFACIWGMPDSRGDLYIIDEWPNEDFYKMHNCQLTVKDYARIFKDKEQTWDVKKRIIDRHFAETPSVVNRRTLREEFETETGLFFYPSYKGGSDKEGELDTGIIKVREYLAYDSSREYNELNRPKLFIDPRCQNLIKSLSNWARDPNTGKVQDAYKDFPDTLRYLLMEDPKIEMAVPYEEPRKIYG